SDLEFITHVFGNNILPMKHAVRHTWLLQRLCTSRHILARVYHVHGKNLKVSELFCTSMQLLTEYKFLLHLILVDNHTNAKNRGSFDMSVDSSNCSAK